MYEMLLALINRTSLWVVNLIMLAVGAAVLVWVWSAITVLRRNVTVHATADRIISLQEENQRFKAGLHQLEEKYGHSLAVMAGVKSVFAELKYLLDLFAGGGDVRDQAGGILKLTLDRISTDLKFSPGELHRCALWLDMDGRRLGMYVASAGFADYQRNHRVLEIDRSAAGRCFRTRTSRYSPNVNKDEDFFHRPGTTHRYLSLICVPLVLGELCLGVISVDGREEEAFRAEDVEMVEAYGEMAAVIRMIQIAGGHDRTGRNDSMQQTDPKDHPGAPPPAVLDRATRRALSNREIVRYTRGLKRLTGAYRKMKKTDPGEGE